MILDKLVEFCDATAIAAATAGAGICGNYIDMGDAKQFPGYSDGAYVVIRMQTAADGGVGASKQFLLQSSTLTALTGGTTKVHYTTPAIVFGSLTAGALVAAFELPKDTYQRYLGLWMINSVDTISAGNVDAFITNDPAFWVGAADALTKPTITT